MAQQVNIQLSPVTVILDSSQANYINVEGSTAIFNLGGGDVDLSHSEARTATVQLLEFHAANTIYNVNKTNNILEIYVQYTNYLGVLQYGESILLIIPYGSYNITTLLSTINNLMKKQCTPKTSGLSTYFTGFGDYFQTTNFQYLQNGIMLDTTTTTTTSTSGVISINTVNGSSGKVKFCTPYLSQLSITDSQITSLTEYKYFYGGFYILTDTYPNLPILLGFPVTQIETLPTYKNLQSPNSQHGFGITLQKKYINNTHSYNVYDPKYLPSLFSETNTTGELGVVSANSLPLLDYPRNIYICIDSISTHNRCSNRKFAYGSVFAKIPIISDFGNVILYEPMTSTEIFCPGLNLDSMTIRLFDDNAEPIDWNGGHWTIILGVKWNIDVGSAGLEDASLGRTYRPYLHGMRHDPLQTKHEYMNNHKRHKKY